MMKKLLIFTVIISLFVSCNSSQSENVIDDNSNKILLLKVDYTTNTFEGGREISLGGNSPLFDTNTQYKSPSDFGFLKVFYTPTNTLLFDGTIQWMGEGKINYPIDFLPASAFAWTDPFGPNQMPVVENIFNPSTQVYDYNPVFLPIINLSKVRQYRQINPKVPAKIFLYTPGVGIGNPATWKWIIMFKN